MKVQLAVYDAGRAGPRQFIKSISQMCSSSHCTHGVESRNVGLIMHSVMVIIIYGLEGKELSGSAGMARIREVSLDEVVTGILGSWLCREVA